MVNNKKRNLQIFKNKINHDLTKSNRYARSFLSLLKYKLTNKCILSTCVQIDARFSFIYILKFVH